jgi:hypothetical protein
MSYVDFDQIPAGRVMMVSVQKLEKDLFGLERRLAYKSAAHCYRVDIIRDATGALVWCGEIDGKSCDQWTDLPRKLQKAINQVIVQLNSKNGS